MSDSISCTIPCRTVMSLINDMFFGESYGGERDLELRDESCFREFKQRLSARNRRCPDWTYSGSVENRIVFSSKFTAESNTVPTSLH